MLENRRALTAVIGYILGIIIGLYCKISIVFFYIFLYLIYLIFNEERTITEFKLFSFKRYFRYVKVIFNKKVIKIIIVFSVISNTIVLLKNYKYENLYKDLNEQKCNFTGIILSQEESRYKVKITNKKYNNTYLYVYLKQNEDVKYGDEIIFSGKFTLPKKASNYKGFNYANYLKTLNIYGIVKTDNIIKTNKNKGNIVVKYSKILSQKIKEKIDNMSVSSNKKSILKGILLGDKTDISEEIIENFSESNILYILAVSGMHISYIIIISNFMFNKTIGKHFSKVLSSTIVFIYMFIVGFSPSVVRAGITGIIQIMSNFFYRKSDIWESLGASLFIILIYNPFLITNIGLELSFAGAIGIILFQRTFNKKIDESLIKINRKAIRKNKKILKFILKALNTKIGKLIQEATIITLSATLTVTPIILINYYKINITNVIAGILVSFIIGPIIILSLMSIIFKISIIEQTLSSILEILIKISDLGSKMPFNQMYVIPPNILYIIIYYIFIFIVKLMIDVNLKEKPTLFQKRFKNIINVIKYELRLHKSKFISIILIISILYSLVLIIQRNLKIYFVDVGQGDCTLVVTPNKKSILIDGGGSETSDIRKRNTYTISTKQENKND